jgi:hypothetical protein
MMIEYSYIVAKIIKQNESLEVMKMSKRVRALPMSSVYTADGEEFHLGTVHHGWVTEDGRMVQYDNYVEDRVLDPEECAVFVDQCGNSYTGRLEDLFKRAHDAVEEIEL